MTETYELRELAALKLFFGDPARPENIAALARAQKDLYEKRLAQFEQLEAMLRLQPGFEYQLAVLGAGVRVERALLGFWSELADKRPPKPTGRRPVGRRAAGGS